MEKTPLLDDNPQIWQARWSVMSKVISQMANTLPDDIAHREMFEQMLINLRCFGEGQFNYFYDKINKQLAPAGRSHTEALTLTLQQIGRDISIISQAIHQRSSNSPSEVQETIGKADRFAHTVLAPARTLLKEPSSAFVYLQKSPYARVVPYAPIALIGVSYSCVNFDDNQKPITRDLLAIAHEVGHYVYWHGSVIQTAAYEGDLVGQKFHRVLWHHLKASGVPEWACYWAEEAFADTYGARTAGPVMAFSIQDLMQQSWSLDEFTSNDGSHPIPYLRPEIYLQTLAKMGLQARADQLADAWVVRRDRVAPNTTKLRVTDNLEVTVDEARAVQNKVITLISRFLANVNYNNSLVKPLFNDAAAADVQNALEPEDTIFALWREEMGIRDTNAARGIAPASAPFEWQPWYNDTLQEIKAYNVLSGESVLDWVGILDGGGWTEGPQGPPIR